MGPNQTYKPWHSKGNDNKMKRQPTEWEKIFANDVTDKGLIIQNIPTAHTAQYKKQTTQSKNGQKI